MASMIVVSLAVVFVITLGLLSITTISSASALKIVGGTNGAIGGSCGYDGQRYSQGEIMSPGLGVSYKCGPGGQWYPYYGSMEVTK